MEKNQKGFTLIELLVVIALMLSILGIAIVSFINISNNKKKEAWEDVKVQIETAATEYFTANEFLFEGLSNGASGEIFVGKLVSDDYLNKITNPITGKSVSMCSVVEVKKNNNKLTATFDEATERSVRTNCNFDKSIIVSEPGAPSGEIIYRKSDYTSTSRVGDWFNIDSLGEDKPLNVCVDPKTNGNGAIKVAKIGGDEVENTSYGYCKTINKDGIYSDVIISLENTSGKKWRVYEDINKDTNYPTIEYIGLNADRFTTYNDIPVYDSDSIKSGERVRIKASDYISEIADVSRKNGNLEKEKNSDNVYYFKSEWGKHEEIFNAQDNAGNKATITGKYIISSKPSCPSFEMDSEIEGNEENTFRSNYWLYAKLTKDAYDAYGDRVMVNGNEVSISSSETDNYRFFLDYEWEDGNYGPYKVSVKNEYGLSRECTSDTYTIDTKAPNCPPIEYYFYKNNGDKKTQSKCYVPDKNGGVGEIFYNNVFDSTLKDKGISYLNCFDVGGNMAGADKTKIEIKVHQWDWDVAGIDWYTNYGNIDNGEYTYQSTWPNSGSWPIKTLTSVNVNNGLRKGYFVVRDAAGNERKCETPIFNIKPYNSTSTTPSSKEDKDTKAYRWEYAGESCIEDAKVTFSSNPEAGACNTGKENCNRKGPYKKYKFTELECKCKYNGKKYVSKSFNEKTDNITTETHPEGYSYIFYKNDKYGKAACKSTGSDANKYVYQVCQHGKITNGFKFHGVIWNTSGTVSINSNWSGQGWYNKSYTSKADKDAFKDDYKKACDWACGKLN